MKLFFTPFSPYTRKCLLMAHELDLLHRIELLVASPNPVTRDPVLVRSNPLGKVPTLITDEGVVLHDSRVICEYLNELGGGSLFPAEGAARWSALTLQALGDGMLDGALLARFEDAARPEALRWPQWRAGQLEKSRAALASLEENIALLHEPVHIGTIAISCALWYLDLRFPDVDWRQAYPRVGSWYEVFASRPSMQATWSA